MLSVSGQRAPFSRGRCRCATRRRSFLSVRPATHGRAVRFDLRSVTEVLTRPCSTGVFCLREEPKLGNQRAGGGMPKLSYGQMEPAPSVILTNAAASGFGAIFTEIESSRYGSFDAVNPLLSLAWSPGHGAQVRYGDSKTFRARETLRILFPGEDLHGEWQGVERTMLMHFPSDLVQKSLHCSSSNLARTALTAEQVVRAGHCLRLAKIDVAGGTAAGPTIMEALASNLLGGLFPDAENSRQLEHAKDSKRIRAMTEYINSNLRRNLRLQEVAAQTGISIRHMSRMFKATIGVAPHEYILAMRVRKATDLIRSRSLGLTDIALTVGFSSHAHMTAAFRRLSGRSPSSFRDR